MASLVNCDGIASPNLLWASLSRLLQTPSQKSLTLSLEPSDAVDRNRDAIINLEIVHDICSKVDRSAHQLVEDDFGWDLVPLEELDVESFDLEPFGGLASFLIFCFFNPYSDLAGGSSS
uniref:Uncharacterized protein n=1 Tax=Tanacetum cinerariifolium TaxID=118510 RepID=A0A6L2KLH2_TANCI|nr:hypothetical protein [Tanacetum cinerariifolium]